MLISFPSILDFIHLASPSHSMAVQGSKWCREERRDEGLDEGKQV